MSDDEKPRRGRRPTGKRSNPDYVNIALYVRRDTYEAVKVKLLQTKAHADASELVEALMTEWLGRLDRGES